MQRILDETFKTHAPYFYLLPFCRHKKVTQKRLNEMNSRLLKPRLCSDSISFIRNFSFMLRNLLIETFVNIHFVDLFSRP